MSKTTGGTTTYHIWDGENIVAESNGSKIIRSYVRGHQLLTDDERRTYMYDGHGNMVQQLKGSTVENKTRYDAFGNVVENSNVNDTPFGYCGEYTDCESGLVYLRNRYYDTRSGRFISEDPVKDGLNWYVYCDGNPVVFVDSNGLSLKVNNYKKGNSNSLINERELGYLRRDLNELLKNKDGSYDGRVNISINGYITLDMNNENSQLAGYKLLNKIINSDDTVFIEVINAKTAKDLKEYANYDYNINEDNNRYLLEENTVLYNYVSTTTVLTVDDSSGERKFNADESISYISLGHELIHAYRDITNQSAYGENVEYKGVLPAGVSSGKGVNAEEFETVGLVQWSKGNSNGRITENDLRAQRGLPLRGWYS